LNVLAEKMHSSIRMNLSGHWVVDRCTCMSCNNSLSLAMSATYPGRLLVRSILTTLCLMPRRW
jgi:hypothetical protein